MQSIRSLDAQEQSLTQAREAAAAALKLADSRYRAGIGNALDMLAAQAQWLSAQQALTALHAQQLQAATRLNVALGGGFQPAAADQTVTSSIAFPGTTP